MHWRHVFIVAALAVSAGCVRSSAGVAKPAADIEEVAICTGAQLCDLLGPALRRHLTDELADQRRRWASTRPAAYTIRVMEMSDCLFVQTRQSPEMRPQLTVRGTTIVDRILKPLPPEYAQRCSRELRVDDLFDELARAIADTTVYIGGGIAYDREYGFPRRYYLVRGHDRGATTVVESFAVAP